jgi:hypothetical protein
VNHCSIEEIAGMTNCELTLMAFEAGMVIAEAERESRPVPEDARDIFVAAYRELLLRPTQTAMVESLSTRSQLRWSCSHTGFEVTRSQLVTLGMMRDRRSPTGYSVMIPTRRSSAEAANP